MKEGIYFMVNEVSKKQKFLQIKNIFAKITSEKDTAEEFKSKTAIVERFNFTKDLCSLLGLPCDYDEQDFEKFDFLLSVIYAINSAPDLLKKFEKMANIAEVVSFIESTISGFFQGDVPVKLEKDDLEAFIYVYSTEELSPKNEGSVSGGFGFSSALQYYSEYGTINRMGMDIGQKLGELVLNIKNMKNKKK